LDDRGEVGGRRRRGGGAVAETQAQHGPYRRREIAALHDRVDRAVALIGRREQREHRRPERADVLGDRPLGGAGGDELEHGVVEAGEQRLTGRRDHQAFGRDRAVDEAGTMSCLERSGDLDRDVEDLGVRQPPVGRDPLAERSILEPLEQQVRPAFRGRAVAVDRDDVGVMRQRFEGEEDVVEPVAEVHVQQAQGDRAVLGGLAGPERRAVGTDGLEVGEAGHVGRRHAVHPPLSYASRLS
jgi:hypothetical protein